MVRRRAAARTSTVPPAAWTLWKRPRGSAAPGSAARQGRPPSAHGTAGTAWKNANQMACAAAVGICCTGAACPARSALHFLARKVPLDMPRSLFGAGVPAVPPRRAAYPSLEPPAPSRSGAAGGARRPPFIRVSAAANRPCDRAGNALCIHWQGARRNAIHPARTACPAMRPAACRATAAILPPAARRGGDGTGRDVARRTAIAPPGMPWMRARTALYSRRPHRRALGHGLGRVHWGQGPGRGLFVRHADACRRPGRRGDGSALPAPAAQAGRPAHPRAASPSSAFRRRAATPDNSLYNRRPHAAP